MYTFFCSEIHTDVTGREGNKRNDSFFREQNIIGVYNVCLHLYFVRYVSYRSLLYIVVSCSFIEEH